MPVCFDTGLLQLVPSKYHKIGMDKEKIAQSFKIYVHEIHYDAHLGILSAL